MHGELKPLRETHSGTLSGFSVTQSIYSEVKLKE